MGGFAQAGLELGAIEGLSHHVVFSWETSMYHQGSCFPLSVFLFQYFNGYSKFVLATLKKLCINPCISLFHNTIYMYCLFLFHNTIVFSAYSCFSIPVSVYSSFLINVSLPLHILLDASIVQLTVMMCAVQVQVVNWTWVVRITAAYIHLKQLKATWDFLPQLHPVLIGYHVRLKLCMPKLCAKVMWGDVFDHVLS